MGLMARIDPHEVERFSDMFERCYGRVFDYAARRLGVEAAGDVASETFLIAWRRRDVLPADPLPWLYGIARNIVRQHRQAHARDQAAMHALASQPGLAAANQPEDPAVWAAWKELAPRDREVLALIAWEDLSVAEAAAVIGCPAPVFSVRLHRARKRLERRLVKSPPCPSRVPNLSEAR